MFTTILIVVLIALLAAGSLVFALVWLVKSHNRSKKAADDSGIIGAVAAAAQGICANCGETRIIVKPELNVCASCYSALRTKKN
jgi:hypothetical protein